MTEYIIKSILCSGLSLLLYFIFLRRGKYFVFCRFYLLVTLLLSLSVPAFNFSPLHVVPVINEISFNKTGENINPVETVNEENIVEVNKQHLPLKKILLSVYILVTFILFLRFIINLAQIIHDIKNKGDKVNGMYVILKNNNLNPYSFFNYLFIDRESFKKNEYSDALFEHEKFHCKQFHSTDIILVEFVKCFFWFNPFVWLYKNAISENHEYLVDSFVVNKGYSKEKYLNNIIRFTNNVNSSFLVSGFSFKHTKKRLIMLKETKQSASKKVTKILLVILVSGIFLSLNSFKIGTTETFLVVVDAGHGGKDSGATINNTSEKDINLSVCRQLAAWSGKDNIKIVLTRSGDEFLSLEDRVNYVNELKPDLLLSIHCNYAKNDNLNGTDVLYFDDGQYSAQSYDYSKTFASEYIKNVTDKGQIKSADFFILKNSDCPGMLIQLGFLSNAKDYKNLTNSDYHYQVASSIFNSLVKISNKY